MTSKTLRWTGIAGLAVAAVVAVGAFSSGGHTHSDSDYLFAHLSARSGSHDAVWIEKSFAEMLPSQQFSIDGAPARTLTSGVVIGRITKVQEGRGFAHPGDAPASTVVGFNAKDALWRTVEVTLAVEEGWGKVAAEKSVTFAVVIDKGANAKAALNGLRTLGRVIVSLDRQGRYAYAPDLYSISHSGDLFGTVDANGTIALPILEHGDEFLQGLDTVTELRTEAGRTPSQIKVSLHEGEAKRLS